MAFGHTITITPVELHVEVRLDGQTLARSDRPVLLEETGLPARYYLPRQDVRTGLLQRTDTVTHCPFKGEASYWSAQLGGTTYPDVAWSYQAPIPAAAGITGLICFYPEKVELTVNGEHQPSSQGAR